MEIAAVLLFAFQCYGNVRYQEAARRGNFGVSDYGLADLRNGSAGNVSSHSRVVSEGQAEKPSSVTVTSIQTVGIVTHESEVSRDVCRRIVVCFVA